MSRLFLPKHLCATWTLQSPVRPLRVGFKQLQLETRNAVRQQQRRQFGGFNTTFSKYRPRSMVWICGAGAGIALAVGLKQQWDSTNSSCDVKEPEKTDRYRAAIEVSRDLVERIKAEVAAPGLLVGVTVDGIQVWCEGIGYADLENRVPCTPESVMRVASISKSLTSAAVARLCDEGKLDLDVPVQQYVPEFPQKQFDGQDVTITPRMILSHLSGIRHYEKDAKKVKECKEKAKRLLKPPVKENANEKTSSENTQKPKTEQETKDKDAPQSQRKHEFDQNEYYLKDSFKSVVKALDLFKDDPLIFKPGTTFLYSTHAFTLLSAVVERAASRSFLDVMMNMFHELGMLNTVPEENDPIIYHRSRYYHLNKKGRIVNCPYIDNSYKWAGGGFLSTVGDLLVFGNALLYSYQVAQLQDTDSLLPGFLKPKSVTDLWKPVDGTEAGWDRDEMYAQAWAVVEKQQKYGQCRKRRHYVSHTGNAVGASSVLLVLPSEEIDQRQGQTPILPQGVVVSIVINMQAVGLNSTALKIAHEFDKARSL